MPALFKLLLILVNKWTKYVGVLIGLGGFYDVSLFHLGVFLVLLHYVSTDVKTVVDKRLRVQ
jgi:hypothetical protein